MGTFGWVGNDFDEYNTQKPLLKNVTSVFTIVKTPKCTWNDLKMIYLCGIFYLWFYKIIN